MAPYLLIAFSSKNTVAKQQQILFDSCVFLKSVLCLLGIMFLNVPFSVLSESYSLHSYTSQYFPIAIETACEESTAE